jgi:hypothetical protein
MAKVELNPPPSNIISHLRVGGEEVEYNLPYQLLIWLNSIFNRVGGGPFLVQGYQVASLPDATSYGSTAGDTFSALIFITDESGGPTMAFSDGTNWLRISDNTIVS